jgi:hypothetical protein
MTTVSSTAEDAITAIGRQDDTVINDEDLARIIRLHQIANEHRQSLRSCLEQTQEIALSALLLTYPSQDNSALRGSGRQFQSFVRALEKAFKELQCGDVQQRLRYAGRPMLKRTRAPDLPFVDCHQTNSTRPAPRNESVYEFFRDPVDIVRSNLCEVLILARAANGKGQRGRQPLNKNWIIPAAAELAFFWVHVLKRRLQLNDWSDEVDHKCPLFLRFADDALILLMEGGADYARFIRDHCPDLKKYMKRVTPSPPPANLQKTAE